MSPSTQTTEKPRTASTIFDCLRTSAATSLVRLSERAANASVSASAAREPEPTGKLLSDAERERAHDLLTDAYLAGRLDEPEYDARVGRAYSARRQSQLDAALEGLPLPPAPAAPAALTAPEPAEPEGEVSWWRALAVLGIFAAVIAAVIFAISSAASAGNDSTFAPSASSAITTIPDSTPANVVRTLTVYSPDGTVVQRARIRGPIHATQVCGGIPDPDGSDCSTQQSATATNGKPVWFNDLDYEVSGGRLPALKQTQDAGN